MYKINQLMLYGDGVCLLHGANSPLNVVQDKYLLKAVGENHMCNAANWNKSLKNTICGN
jgi:hypothetical protein